MYLGFPNRSDCDRARELASRSLDGDLTEFDLGVLRAHLQECVACAEVAAAMGEVTERVRTAVPMDPAPPDVVAHAHVVAIDIRAERELRVPTRRRARPRIAASVVAVVATVAAAGAGALVASNSQRTGTQVKPRTTLAELTPLDHQFRSIHEGRLLLLLPAPRIRSPHVRSTLV
jgi:predicted anti-sigma-YlaC factor YlaD